MIYAYTGKTGSGKTYRMVQHGYQYWRHGIDVYSNTVLYFTPSGFDRIRDWLYKVFKKPPFQYGRIRFFQNITEILDVHSGVILFDEAQVLFNARNWESLPDEFQYKLQQHRKHKLDLLCTTQNMGTIDIMYRRLVQVWYHHEPVFGLGDLTFGIFRSKLKDVDELYNSVDDLAVSDVQRSFFLIGKVFFWRPRLYDTLYDIGFERFKTLWLTSFNPALNKFQRQWMILPKKWTLKEGQTAISSYQGLSYSRNRSTNFKKG